MISKTELKISELERDIEELRMEKASLGFAPDEAVLEIDQLIEDKEMEIAHLEHGQESRIR
jgi:hypothetical protein